MEKNRWERVSILEKRDVHPPQMGLAQVVKMCKPLTLPQTAQVKRQRAGGPQDSEEHGVAWLGLSPQAEGWN